MSVIKFKANPDDPNSEWITVPVIAGPKGEPGEKGEKGDRGNDGGLTDEQQSNLNKVPELMEKVENHEHSEFDQIGTNRANIENMEVSLSEITNSVSENTTEITSIKERLTSHTHSEFAQIESNKNEISKIKDSINSGEVGGSFKTDWGNIPPAGGLDESTKVSLKKGIQSRLENYAGVNGEVIVNVDKKTLHVMDGATRGGTRLATHLEIEELNIPDPNDYYTKEEIDETNAEISERLNDMELSGFKTQWGDLSDEESSVSVSMKKGSTLNVTNYKGTNGELIVNTDTYAVHIMDGENFGGTELARKSDLESKVLEINEKFNDYTTDDDLQEFLDLKVNAEEGKGLSTNDFDDGYKYKLDNLSNYELPIASSEVVGGIKVGSGLTVGEDGALSVIGGSDGQGGTVDLSNYYTKKEVDTSLNNKVDKDGNKVLSTNDFTNDYKNKLNSLNNYELPVASSSVVGGVKIGSGLTVGADGTLSVIGGSSEGGGTVDLSNYYTKQETYNKTEIDSKISNPIQPTAIKFPSNFPDGSYLLFHCIRTGAEPNVYSILTNDTTFTVDSINYYNYSMISNKLALDFSKNSFTTQTSNQYGEKLTNLVYVETNNINWYETLKNKLTKTPLFLTNRNSINNDLSNYYTKEEVDNLLENLNPDGTGSADLEELNTKINTLTELVEDHLLDGPVNQVELIEKKRDNIGVIGMLLELKEEINNIKKSLKL